MVNLGKGCFLFLGFLLVGYCVVKMLVLVILSYKGLCFFLIKKENFGKIGVDLYRKSWFLMFYFDVCMILYGEL